MTIKRSISAVVWALWHLGAVFAIVAILTQLRIGTSLWLLPHDQLVFVLSVALAYLACVTILAIRTADGKALGLLEATVILLAAFGGCALLFLIQELFYSRSLLVAMIVLLTASIVLSFVLPRRVLLILTGTVIALAAALQPLDGYPDKVLSNTLGLYPKPQRAIATIRSSLYTLRATFYDNYFNVFDSKHYEYNSPRTGGAISRFADQFLLTTGEGRLYVFHEGPDSKSLLTQRLPYDVPINSEEFRAGGATDRDISVFRVMGILVRDRGERFELYTSHEYFKTEQRCVVLRVSRIEGDYKGFISGTIPKQWQTIYESQPCLPLKKGRPAKLFGGDGVGGRMVLLNDTALLLTVGDFQWDGWNWEERVSQDPRSPYGKIMKVDLKSGAAEIYSSGHRNPEGLYRSPNGKIWATEHGPEGGDELNLIIRNGNYGWPYATYGTEYGTHDWPLSVSREAQSAYLHPVFAWVPDVAVSNLISVERHRFPKWQHDLLIASFSQSLLRAHLEGDQVVYVEPILLRRKNGRLRDLLEDSDGRLVFYLDTGAIAFVDVLDEGGIATAGDNVAATDGAALFANCAACHKVGDGTQHGIGPDLKAIVGRKMASAAGYTYSKALRALEGSWTRDNLDRFLANPQAVAPGTAMQMAGIPKARDREALIRYLETLR